MGLDSIVVSIPPFRINCLEGGQSSLEHLRKHLWKHLWKCFPERPIDGAGGGGGGGGGGNTQRHFHRISTNFCWKSHNKSLLPPPPSRPTLLASWWRRAVGGGGVDVTAQSSLFLT